MTLAELAASGPSWRASSRGHKVIGQAQAHISAATADEQRQDPSQAAGPGAEAGRQARRTPRVSHAAGGQDADLSCLLDRVDQQLYALVRGALLDGDQPLDSHLVESSSATPIDRLCGDSRDLAGDASHSREHVRSRRARLLDKTSIRRRHRASIRRRAAKQPGRRGSQSVHPGNAVATASDSASASSEPISSSATPSATSACGNWDQKASNQREPVVSTIEGEGSGSKLAATGRIGDLVEFGHRAGWPEPGRPVRCRVRRPGRPWRSRSHPRPRDRPRFQWPAQGRPGKTSVARNATSAP